MGVVYRWVYAVDASVRFFIRDINSLRLLIINAAIPMMVLATYELLIGMLSAYVDSVIAIIAPYSRAMVGNFLHFIGSIMYLITAALIMAFTVTSAFMVNGLISSLRNDLRAIINIFRSSTGIITYISLIMILTSAYSFALGISISAALILVIMKVLTTLGVVPINNYGINIVGALPELLPLLLIITLTYVVEGVVWVRRYASLP